ncbi:hypothetical protein ACL02P_15500 [Paenibacillus sp. MB22_1]|uniref:hypothetical protein n=1 Tax=Paenibacillus sp. MB22_1 TaxID=3383121 RepID=UPI00399F47CC
MKASELVEMLQHLVDQYGDREIMFINYTESAGREDDQDEPKHLGTWLYKN